MLSCRANLNSFDTSEEYNYEQWKKKEKCLMYNWPAIFLNELAYKTLRN